MDDITMLNGGLPPDRSLAADALAEAIRAHDLAARLVEAAYRLHPVLPDSVPARERMGALLTEVSAIEDAVVAELRRLLDVGLTPADVALVEAHGDRMFALRPRLGRFIDRLLIDALARQAGLRAAA